MASSKPIKKAPPQEGDKKALVKAQQYSVIATEHKFVTFKGTPLMEQDGRFVPLTSDSFARAFYQHFPYASAAQIKEVEHKVRVDSPDLSPLSHLIQFGTQVWDAKALHFLEGDPDTVLRSPVSADPASQKTAFTYMLELANHDEELAWDMLQGLAPLFMARRPAGVVWFVGGGANGKSALINAIYKIIGDHLTSLTVAAIEDGRDTPRLNGVLGNVCRESSEGRVEDTERYKAIGTHEGFEVHKFHSQDMVHVGGDFHTVFNANNIPAFSDKTEGARRRTLIIPFPARFKDDPTFEDRTFTPEFLGGLLSLILEATHIIRDNGYQYRFSKATLGAKADYDAEVNSAEAFLDHLRLNKVKAFTNYHMLRMAYESWCSDHGLVPLGVTNLKRVMTNMAHAESRLTRDDVGATRRWYFIDGHSSGKELVSLDNGMHVGLKVGEGDESKTPTPVTEQQKLGGDW